jgi:hypothetical protein
MSGAELRWLSSDIAIGRVRRREDWREVYEAGIRAVVDLRDEPADCGAAVRETGMRYLQLCLRGESLPNAEELQIVAGWVQERVTGDGRVLIQDGESRCNDGLVAVASLIRSGLPAHLALLALRRAAPAYTLDSRQHSELVRFASAQAMS